MRILRLNIAGYGRFVERQVELLGGWQIICGPNEQGKSTLRSFIADVLFGQNPDLTPDEDARRPWNSPDRYGGSVVYQTDDGRVFEAVRTFGAGAGRAHIRTLSLEDGSAGPWQEAIEDGVHLASERLGITREVFLGAATISHLTLNALGDENALAEIREKLLSLADSGEESISSDKAIEHLNAMIEAIGLPGARNRPLPQLKNRLATLSEEFERVQQFRRELTDIEEKRRGLVDQERALRRRRIRLREELTVAERIERAARLAEAEAVETRLEALRQQMFAFSHVREFPLDQAQELRRIETVLAGAQAQIDHMREERVEIEQELSAELRRLEQEAGPTFRTIPEETEVDLEEIETLVTRLRDRLEQARQSCDAARERIEEVLSDLAKLPDFGQFSGDPVEWVAEATRALRTVIQHRDIEVMHEQQIRDRITRCRESITGPQTAFADVPDFPALVREFELETRFALERSERVASERETTKADAEEVLDRLPGFRNMTIVSGLFLAVLLTLAVLTPNPGLLIASVLAGLCLIWFTGNWVHTERTLRQRMARIDELEREASALASQDPPRKDTIDRLMKVAGCGNLRELEGLHDQYRETMITLASLEEALAEQTPVTGQAVAEYNEVTNRYRQAFAEYGAPLEREDQPDKSAATLLARYQEYRESRRRMLELRRMLEKRQRETDRIQTELEEALAAERELTQQVRGDLRESGFIEEARHESALRALRAYRIRASQGREARGRVELLKENAAMLDRRIEREEADQKRCEATLARLLEEAHVDSIDAWHRRAEDARCYRELREQASFTERQFETLLQGQDLDALRALVEADGPVPEDASGDPEALRAELQTLAESIDNLQQEERNLHVVLAAKAAHARSINEIEEDRAAVQQRIDRLEFDRQTASYAIAQIEEVARDKHARLAPRLAAAASDYLDAITGGAYSELSIDPDFRIRVRIPETRRLEANIEHRLSQGTVDQIYFALRLAMVGVLSEPGERVPLLLDDPFANYDDERLERAMTLLAHVSQEHQVLLFTCRDDVVRAAQRAGSPIIEL